MRAKGIKAKNLSVKKYLRMIGPYLSDIINDHKTQEVVKFHSGNKVIDYETNLGEWKIQLLMTINFVPSENDSDEIRAMHIKSDNIYILMGNETDEIINFLNLFCKDLKKDQNNQ